MTTTTTARRPREWSADAQVLHNVPWDIYVGLRDTGNPHIRMSYHDGTLHLMSPEFIHEVTAERLGMLVRAVAAAFDLTVVGTRSTTFRRPGVPSRGTARSSTRASTSSTQRRRSWGSGRST